jgi:quercetin dioxygenase-like cupin family protein
MEEKQMIVVNSSDAKVVVNPNGDPMVLSGEVYLKRVIDGNDSGGSAVSSVTFAPGARLKFHTHGGEQILYVTEGKGIVATREKEYVVTAGMVVLIPSGVEHWHGAVADSTFSHVAFYKGGSEVTEATK